MNPVLGTGNLRYVLTRKYSYTFLQIPLGILLKTETKYEDMVGIMDYLHQYIPTVTSEYFYEDQESGTLSKVSGDHFHHVLMGKYITCKHAFYCKINIVMKYICKNWCRW